MIRTRWARAGVLLMALLCLCSLYSGVAMYEETPWFYAQLDSNAQAVYRAIDQGPGERTVSLPQPVTFTTSVADAEESEAARQQLAILLQSAVDAYRMDQAGAFWCGSVSYRYQYTGNQQGDWIDWKVTEITLTVTAGGVYTGLVDEVAAAQDAAVWDFPVSGITRYERLLSIHDELARRVTYVLDADRAHEAAGALLDGEAVCEGYAKAFKLLCDREEIPCLLVVGLGQGSAHMWNMVQMEDDRWYAVDVTWDDQESRTLHEFFLAGEQTPSALCNGAAFEETHRPYSDISQSGLCQFAYPLLAAASYVPQSVSHQRGDVNGDGKVSITDARLLLQAAVGKTIFNAEQVSVGDFNGDGQISTTDARWALQIAVGKRAA